jgi:hypothetical protein
MSHDAGWKRLPLRRLSWIINKEPYESEDVIRERFGKYEEDVTTS